MFYGVQHFVDQTNNVKYSCDLFSVSSRALNDCCLSRQSEVIGINLSLYVTAAD